MRRRDFLEKIFLPCRAIAHNRAPFHTDASPGDGQQGMTDISQEIFEEDSKDTAKEGEHELFLKAMALGIDPATVDPERLRELVHANP